MHLVTEWVWIEEYDLDPVIPATSSDTKKGKTGSIVLILEIITILYYYTTPTTINPEPVY